LLVLKALILFGTLIALLIVSVIFALNHGGVADRYSAWYMRLRQTYAPWYRWTIRRATPYTVRASAAFLAVGCLILTAVFAGAIYPQVRGITMLIALSCGVIFLAMIVVLNIVAPGPGVARARKFPLPVRLLLNVGEALLLLLIVFTVVSIVHQCFSQTGCR
jgi:hypothetical protein